MKASVILLFTLLLTGCASLTPASKRDFPEFSTAPTTLVFDDPASIFAPVFPPYQYRWFARQKLETEAEHRQRLASSGLHDREVTFLIDPELCDVIALPDEDFYVITIKDQNFDYIDRRMKEYRAVSIRKSLINTTDSIETNRFGTAREVTTFRSIRHMVRLENFAALPASLIWKETSQSHSVQFGLPVRTKDPTFRTLLKEKKITLALRGRVGDPATCEQTSEYSQSKFGESTTPIVSSTEVHILPLILEAAFVYDTATGSSLVHWQKK
jgi:hypothetical protein